MEIVAEFFHKNLQKLVAERYTEAIPKVTRGKMPYKNIGGPFVVRELCYQLVLMKEFRSAEFITRGLCILSE